MWLRYVWRHLEVAGRPLTSTQITHLHMTTCSWLFSLCFCLPCCSALCTHLAQRDPWNHSVKPIKSKLWFMTLSDETDFTYLCFAYIRTFSIQISNALSGRSLFISLCCEIRWWLWCNFTSNTVPQWLKTRVVGGLSSGFSAHLFIDYHILYLDVYRFIFTLYLFL